MTEAAAQLSGADQRRWLDRLELEHDDIRAVLDRAVAQPDPPVGDRRRVLDVAVLAEARPPGRGAARASRRWRRRRGRRTTRGCGRGCSRRSAARSGGRARSPRWAGATRRRSRSGSRSATSTRSPTRYYNASFQHAVPRGVANPDVPTDVEQVGLAHIEAALEIYRRIGDRRGEANALWALGNYHYFHESTGDGVEQFRQALEHLPRVRRPDDGGLVAPHARDRACSATASSTRRARRSSRRCAISWPRATRPGSRSTLDDASAVAVAEGDLPRAARLRGAARNLTAETGAGLASYVEDIVRLAGEARACARACPRTISRATARRGRR